MTAPKYACNPRTCEYVASFGLDPNRIKADDWDSTGYTYVHGEGPMGDSRHTERRAWPIELDYQTLLTRWTADEPTRRFGRNP